MIKKIVIKRYEEFTETMVLDEVTQEHFLVAKEVEAIIQLEDNTTYSLGFSVMRDNDLFFEEKPREMVRKFISDNLKADTH